MRVSKEIKENVNKLEELTINGLKDFQKETVNRVAYLFDNEQNRVLVADEVGMGKTMIAKGVIAKMAQIRIKEGDDLFKVVYICSNQAIAKQNIKTLDIVSMLPQFANDPITDTSDTRLSMQHLKVTQQENDSRLREKYIQIIPLTPGTSFEMSQGCGNIRERALLCAVMSRVKELKEDAFYLRRIFVLDARASGYWYLDEYEKIVKEIETKTGNKYPANILKKLKDYKITVDEKEVPIIKFTKSVMDKRKERNCTKASNCYKCPNYRLCKRMISELRIIFAKISTENLNPDLVIMDEFQRFNSLIDINNNDETGILARKFLQEDSEDLDKKTRVLLLSATPYKLYTTMEEMDSPGEKNPYDEFFNVMNFLFEKEREDFSKTWNEYTESLRAAQKNGFTVLKIQKEKAENAMYKGVCRTERISVMEDGDYIDDSSKDRALEISEGDIQSYIQMQTIVNSCGSKNNVPIDYIKSSPYLMSFMDKYKLKESIKQKFKEGADLEIVRKPYVWLNKSEIDRYQEIPDNNARLTLLKKEVFSNNAEKLLWCPPTKPYYALEGAYKGIDNFSKVLVFSAWEMVPRMISTLVSYELERKIYGGKFKYTDERKIPRRLEFRVKRKQEPTALNLFTMIYPSKTLAGFYKPIECLNKKLSLKDIESSIKQKIEVEIKKLKKYEKITFGNATEASNRWYYLAPILMDGVDYANTWLDSLGTQQEQETEENRYSDYLRFLRNTINSEIKLGRMPKDLVDYLCNAVLGSFAVCYYRSCSEYDNVLKNSTSFAKVFLKNFNSPEIISIIDEIYGKNRDYLSNVLRYCKEGCFQAMLDEYIHLLQRNGDGLFQNDLINNLDMLQTSHYEIDTQEAFASEVAGELDRSKRINMRSHFAVCFSKTADKNEGERKENLRNAFNSPLRPFVLASTSIGQEGLDFHNYCRKIMHWNLPSNPIDLEQREGRINRYKCLAIRQNVSYKYGDKLFKANVWNELFEYAKAGERGEKQSELIPFWCFGKNQTIKIERILPLYPMSNDINRYERLIKILSLYRMTLGQPRQEELLEYIFSNFSEEEQNKMKELFINLSPWSKKQETE